MNELVNSYLAQVEQKLKVGEADKRQIVKELRNHLNDRIEEEKAARPGEEEDAIVREVLNDFGSPDDLALAYGPEGTTVRDAAGRALVTLPVVVKGVGRAVGKGAGHVARGAFAVLRKFVLPVLIAVIALAGIGLVVGFFLFDDITALVATHAPQGLYQETVRCRDDPCTQAFVGHFDVVADRYDRIVLDAYIDRADDAATGTLRLVVVGPDGSELFNRTAGPGDPDRVYLEATWSAREGQYSVRYEVTDFSGTVQLSVDGYEARP